MSGGGTQTSTTTSGPPAQVLQQYQNVTGIANQVAQTPLEQYSGQMVEGFTPQQTQSFQDIQDAQGIANPYINAASQYASSAATPISVPAGMSTSDLSNLETSGVGLSNSGANTNVAAAGAPGVATANQGVAGINSALGLGSTANYGSNIGTYMSPYTSDVVNATQAEFNNQNQQQNQSIVGNAISSGAWGGDRAGVAQGVAAGQEALAQAPVIAGLENTGYSNAQSELNAQQQLGVSGSTAAGQLGTSIGSLGQSAASTEGQLEQAAAAQQLGLYNTQQQTNVGAQEATGWLGSNAANELGALGQEAQSSALTDANALYSAGTQQQTLGQEQLNIPYEEFEAQQAYPFQTTSWLSGIDEGIGSGEGGTSSTTTPTASTASQVAGGLLGTAGLLGATGAFGSNGWLTGTSINSDLGQQLGDQYGITNFDTPSTDLPEITGARGGRIRPRGFAAGGVPETTTGIENPDVSFIPVSTGQTGMMNSWLKTPQTTNTQTASSDGGIGGVLGDIAGVAKIATLFAARGGHIPRAFASGGTSSGTPSTGVVGSTIGSRGISIPVLATPSATQQSDGVTSNLTTNYSPPPVSSLPYTATSFPSLTVGGSSAQPTTVSVTPTLGSNGQWSAPNQPAAASSATSNNGLITLPGGQQINLSALLAGEGLGSLGMRRGGPVGLRSRYDSGGLVGQAGAISAGAPVAGGSPIANSMYQNISQLSPEKLQELAARLPPNSAQGQLVRRALQTAHANPQQAQQVSQAAQQSAQPQATISAMPAANANIVAAQPTMARGGPAPTRRRRYADGSDVQDDAAPSWDDQDANRAAANRAWLSGLGNSIVSGLDSFGDPDSMRFRPSPAPILDAVAADAPSLGSIDGSAPSAAESIAPTGYFSDPSDPLAVPAMWGPLATLGGAPLATSSTPGTAAPPKAGTPAGFRPRPAPAIDAVSPNVSDLTIPIGSDVDRASGDAHADTGANSGTDTGSNFMRSPWMALAAAGAGMMASRAPKFGNALGEGLETGIKFAGQQQSEADKQAQQQAENRWKSKSYDLEAQKLADSIENTKSQRAIETQRLANQVQEHQDTMAMEAKKLGISVQELALRQQEADRGNYEPTQMLKNKDGSPQLDENGHPLASWVNRYDPSQTKIAPAPDAGLAGNRQGFTQGLAQQLIANGSAKDMPEALAMIHDPAGHYAAQVQSAAATRAVSDAKSDPEYQTNPTDTQNRWNAYWGVKIPGQSGSATPNSGAPAPAATASAPAQAAPKAAPKPLIQNGWMYDPVTHQPLGQAPSP